MSQHLACGTKFVYLNSNYNVMYSFRLIPLVCLFMFLSCARKNNVTEGNSTHNENVMLYATVGDHTEKGDALTIREIKLTGNVLKVSVTYSGGCDKHTFSLVGSRNISKSMPPRRAVNLIHKAQGDQCKKAVMEDLWFEISELAYKKEDSSRIWLDLEGWKQAIEYTYSSK